MVARQASAERKRRECLTVRLQYRSNCNSKFARPLRTSQILEAIGALLADNGAAWTVSWTYTMTHTGIAFVCFDREDL
jgi:hypothetical protein